MDEFLGYFKKLPLAVAILSHIASYSLPDICKFVRSKYLSSPASPRLVKITSHDMKI